MKPLQEQFEKTFVPEKDEKEKIAACDSSIRSCIDILWQEIENRKAHSPDHLMDQFQRGLSVIESSHKEMSREI